MAASLQRSLDLKELTLTASVNYYVKQLGKFDTTDSPSIGQKRYIVSATVSDLSGAGTLANVCLKINGTKASSSSINISRTFAQSLVPGATTTQLFELPDLGDLLTIDVELASLILSDQLHLRYIVVVDTSDKKITIFPCYRWISSKMILRNGNASLAFKESNPLLRAQRLAELKDRQATFTWGTNAAYTGWPGYAFDGILDVPDDVDFADAEGASFIAAALSAGARFGLKVLQSSNEHYTDFKAFYDVGKGMGTQGDDEKVMKQVFTSWTLDEEFGRQYLNGHHPVVLEKCRSLPPNFPAEEELKIQGLTVESGSLYIANYSVMDSLLKPGEMSTTAFYCAPICLFRMLPNGKLIPIIIQLHQKPGAENPLWTSRDGLGWLLAKMYVRNADGNLHQTLSHLMKTHLVLEAVTVAMWRQLPEAHPVFKLLAPHTRTTLAINAAARGTLINAGGLFDQGMAIGVKGASALIRRAFSTFKIQDLHFLEAIRARGMNGDVPHYYFRDDGIKLFHVISDYVKEVIDIYYLNDDDIKQDTELQAWMLELYTHGFPGETPDGTHHGFTGSMAKKEELVSLLNIIIFQASAGHASINFSQMAYYGFAPNAPLMMRAPPPTSKVGITMETVMASLPRVPDVSNQVSTVYTLSRYANGEVFLGVFPELHFTDAATNAAAKKFKANLDRLNTELSARNASLGAESYPYMLPSLVPNSIAK